MHIATKSSRINISEEIKTESIAKVFSKNVKVGDTIFLRGELGVGKTTFVRYLINFLQIKNKQSKRNSLKIFTSGDIINFKNKLNKIGIKNKINYLST